MTETPEPEPDVATQLVDIGKKYLRFISLMLDSATRDLQPRAKRAKQAPEGKKPDARPPTQNLGISRWLKGPKVEERKDS